MKRQKVLDELGGACAYCGIDDSDILCIDHIHDDGATDRREAAAYAGQLFRWVLKQGIPKDRYQVLCFNCNIKKYRTRQAEKFPAEHSTRAWDRGYSKSHCVNGHARTPETLYVAPKTGKRGCRLCIKAASKAAYPRCKDKKNQARRARRLAKNINACGELA